MIVATHCSAIYSYNSNPTVQKLYQNISPDDLLKPMGELRDSVKDIDQSILLEEIDQLATQTAVISRLLQEHEIKVYDAVNRKVLEAALVREFSGEKDAVKKAFDESTQENKKEEEKSKLEKSDASLGWFFGSEPTEKSEVGRAYKKMNEVKQKKDAINATNYALVIKNQNTVLSTLQQELAEKKFFMAKYAQAFQHYNKGTNFFTENGLNFDAAKEEGYFDILSKRAYVNTVQKAQEMGISVSIEDMQDVARKNPQTAKLVTDLEAAQTHAKEERNKILNPQPTPRINLMGEDQDDQGALSQ